MKKKFLLFSILYFLIFNLNAENLINKQRLIPANSWLYEAISVLYMDLGQVSIIGSAPYSYEEFYFYFSKIDYSKLCENSKVVYEKIKNFFEKKEFEFNFEPLKIGFNLNLYSQLNYKSNDEVDWTFSNPYDGNRYYDYEEKIYKTANYGDESFVASSQFFKPFALLPVYFNFAEIIMIYTEPTFTKSYWGMNDDKNFTNIPYNLNDFDFYWPKTAYISTGKLWNNNFGINFHTGRSGHQIGRSSLGSVIYNNTFETEAYSKLDLYTENFRAEINVVQVNPKRYMYLHNYEIKLFNKIRFSVLEGTFVNDDFELRYLNPFMIMHSYGAKDQNKSEFMEKYYGATAVCQYFGASLDIVPFRNFKIYALYAQNETQQSHELKGAYGRSMPDAKGVQVGIQYDLPYKTNGLWSFNIEGLYTSPYLYVKPGKEWSLISYRSNMLSKKGVPIYTWMGSPFGPDTMALEAKITYKNFEKFEIDFSYLFVAHGEKNTSMLNATVETEEGTIWAFYPAVLRKLGLLTDEESAKIARDMSLSGIIQYTNQFKIHGNYVINNNFKLDSEIIYMLILNNNNIKSNFLNNFQISFGVEYNLF